LLSTLSLPEELQLKSFTKYLTLNTKKRRDFINITADLSIAVAESNIKEGLALVSAMHITASVYINDDEDGLIADIEEWLDKLAPARPDYRHHQTGEDNADAHLKNLLLHHQVLVPITDGRLTLGTWQQVFYAEFDGQRSKRVIVKIIGE
jgi:secondary thiamine-phosphate synthase enzyme